MRPELIVLLIAAALLACVDGAFAATASKSTTAAFPGMTHAFTDNQDIISTKRSLRISKEPSEVDEERSSFDKITGLVKPGASKFVDKTNLKYWLRQDRMNRAQFLKKLGLGDDAVTKALVSAEKQANAKTLAQQLRKDQHAAWLKNNKKSPEEVVKALNTGV